MVKEVLSLSPMYNQTFFSRSIKITDVASKLWGRATTFGVDGGENVYFHIKAIRCMELNDQVFKSNKEANKSNLL